MNQSIKNDRTNESNKNDNYGATMTPRKKTNERRKLQFAGESDGSNNSNSNGNTSNYGKFGLNASNNVRSQE